MLSETRANEVKKLLIQNGMDKNVIKIACILHGFENWKPSGKRSKVALRVQHSHSRAPGLRTSKVRCPPGRSARWSPEAAVRGDGRSGVERSSGVPGPRATGARTRRARRHRKHGLVVGAAHAREGRGGGAGAGALRGALPEKQLAGDGLSCSGHVQMGRLPRG